MNRRSFLGFAAAAAAVTLVPLPAPDTSALDAIDQALKECWGSLSIQPQTILVAESELINIRAVACANLLRETMLAEERMMLFGKAG